MSDPDEEVYDPGCVVRKVLLADLGSVWPHVVGHPMIHCQIRIPSLPFLASHVARGPQVPIFVIPSDFLVQLLLSVSLLVPPPLHHSDTVEGISASQWSHSH